MTREVNNIISSILEWKNRARAEKQSEKGVWSLCRSLIGSLSARNDDE